MANPTAVSYSAASSPVGGGRFILSSFWRNLSPGWTKLPTTAPGGAPPGGIVAYSGMAVDGRGHRLFLFGGGHNDYFGNEVWRLDLNTFVWSRDYAPDIGANPAAETIWPRVNAATLPGGYIDTNRPYSRHTYNSVHWMPDRQRMIAGGGSSYSGTGEYLWDHLGGPHLNSPQDTWEYDPVAKTWEFRGSTRLNAQYLAGSASAYDTEAKRLYALGKNAGGFFVIYEYDPELNLWTNHNVSSGTSASAIAFGFDSARKRVLVFAGEYPVNNNLLAYDVVARAWQNLTPPYGSPPATYDYGIAYDAENDVYIATKNGTAWVFNPNTGAWAQKSAGPPNVAQVNGRLFYDRVRRVTLLAYKNGMSGPVDVWAYKTETD